MRCVSVGCLLALFFLVQGGTGAGGGRVWATGLDERTLVALDLMDLDIPGEGDGDQMDLPPVQEPESPAAESNPPTSPQNPGVSETGRSVDPVSRGTAPPPSTGIAPFLLEGAGRGGGESRGVTTSTETYEPAVPAEELPTELKSVPLPPSRAGSLKLPADMEAETSDVPEIPLLKAQEGARGLSAPGGEDASLSLKPLPDLYGAEGASRNSAPPRARRRPEDYLQVREDVDNQLIKIHERFYKSR